MHSRPRLAAALVAVALATAPLAACTSAPTGGSAVAGTGAPSSLSSSGPVSSSTAASSGSSPASSGPGVTVVPPPADTTASPPSSTHSRTTVTTTVTPTTSHHTTAPPHTSSRHTATPTTPASAPASTGHSGPVPSGTVVVIDPGHNGANAEHPEIINQQVPAGFGQYKPCNTTGTQTNAGYPEYRFNWKVALALRADLQAKGITVVMTRDSDDGVGPCVNKRAAIGNDAHAAAVISIHGDGEAAGVRGFYVMTASRAPAGAAMAAQSTDLAVAVRNGLSGAGFPISNTLGSDGLWQRSDLAGLNLSVRPTVMIECGNMRNATEAALMSSPDGQQRYAAGIASGVLAYLGR